MKVFTQLALLAALLISARINFPKTLWAFQDQTSPNPPAQSEPATEPAPTQSSPAPSAAPEQQPPTPKTGATPQTVQPPKSVGQGSKPAVKRRRKRKTLPADPSGKVVVKNGGARDNSTQLAPAMTKEQELHQRENTTQLLATTDANLKSIEGRQLAAPQQSMLDQIHTYVRQAQAAADSGDLPRAHTLAYKAHLLSDELVRK